MSVDTDTTAPHRPYALGRIQTYSGRMVRPTSLRISDIDPADIAHSLSQQCRFTGHTSEFYSVAQHCVNVATYVVAHDHETLSRDDLLLQLGALVHDASEAYLVDLPSPIKHLPQMARFRELEHDIQLKIEAKFGLPLGFLSDPRIKQMDRVMLATEAHSFMRAESFNLDKSVEPLPLNLRGWAPGEAKRKWLKFYDELCAALALTR